MSDTMVERVARALGEKHLELKGYGLAFASEYARAAIAAMREPTEAMVHKGRFGLEVEPSFTPEHGVRRCWQAMIDAAILSETGEGE